MEEILNDLQTDMEDEWDNDSYKILLFSKIKGAYLAVK